MIGISHYSSPSFLYPFEDLDVTVTNYHFYARSDHHMKYSSKCHLSNLYVAEPIYVRVTENFH